MEIIEGLRYPTLQWEESTIQIRNAKELARIGAPNFSEDYPLDRNYILLHSIDLKNEPWTPIGTWDKVFTGTFDGGGNTISNLKLKKCYIKDAPYKLGFAGLFARLESATIENLKIEKITIEPKAIDPDEYYIFYVGGLAAMVAEDSNVKDITLNVDITIENEEESKRYDIGGLAGEFRKSSLSNCCVTGKIIGKRSRIGGLIYWLVDSSIDHSYSEANLEGRKCGGLVTWARTSHDSAVSEITNSYATGNVTGSNIAGGLIAGVKGIMGGNVKINDVYATGNVTGTFAAGLIANVKGVARINDVYATGNVTASMSAGGLIGSCSGITDGQIANAYAVGKVKFGPGEPERFRTSGGLIAPDPSPRRNSNYEIISSYWDMETTEQETSEGEGPGQAEGKSHAEMMQESTYVNWDFTKIWRIVETESYPTFLFSPDGLVTEGLYL